MKVLFKVDGDGNGYVAALDTSNVDSSVAEHRKAATVLKGQEIELDFPDVLSADRIGFGNVTDSESGVPVTETPGSDEGQTGADKPGGGNEGSSAEPASTSAASEKPLYLVDTSEGAIDAPEGFTASGLETPDGKTLFHFDSDTAGQSATGNVDGVSVYADADDNEKPVQPASNTGTGQETATA